MNKTESYKIRDPRDKRRKLYLISTWGIRGHDCTAWSGFDGIAIYISQDAPKSEFWTWGLTLTNYKNYLPSWAWRN